MRKQLLILALVGVGCAAHPVHPSLPVQYSCGDLAIVHDGNTLQVSGDRQAAAAMSWRDDAGSHFLVRPVSPTDVDVVEYVVPDDPRQDASERVFDSTEGSSAVDWRLVKRQVCVARGGYSDALVRYAHGATVGELADNLTAGDREQALGLVHHALRELQSRYYKEH
ncbi:MAG: hypothetical protein ABI678_30830 [Kofleriaceae bacterium]